MLTEEKTFKPCQRGQHDQCAKVNVFDPTSVCVCSCHGMDIDLMSQEEFERLLEYSASLPTGTTIGKKWRCRRPAQDDGEPPMWYTGEYTKDPDPTMVGIKWRRVMISELK